MVNKLLTPILMTALAAAVLPGCDEDDGIYQDRSYGFRSNGVYVGNGTSFYSGSNCTTTNRREHNGHQVRYEPSRHSTITNRQSQFQRKSSTPMVVRPFVVNNRQIQSVRRR